MVDPVKGKKKRMPENYPNLWRETEIEFPEAQIPNKRNLKRPKLKHIIREKVGLLKGAMEK